MRRVAALAAALLMCGVAAAEEMPLQVHPGEVRLDGGRDRQAIVVVSRQPDGTTRDVTDAAELSLAEEGIAAIEGRTLIPRADGSTRLVVAHEGRTVEVPLTVRNAARRPPLTFAGDCLPILTRAGCNSGTCHGSSRGKEGFRLSLFGYDPAGDYQRITRQMSGRRINLAAPEESLLLAKATAQVKHGGGRRLPADGEGARTLLEWLEAGARPDPKDLARPLALEVHPPEAVLLAGKAQLRLVVRAIYPDGSDRDVTRLATLYSTDPTTAAVSEDGTLTAGTRGEAHVLARFDVLTVGAPVLVVPDDPGYRFPGEPEGHPVDRLVNAKLRALRVQPSPLADDETFLRRVTLDLGGRLPSPSEREAFLADGSEDKRAQLIDRLLAAPDFTQLWVMLWAERLLIRSDPPRVGPKAVARYAAWLRERVRANVPIGELVVELLTATGGTFETPAANFYHAEQDPLKLAENVAQAFLGMRVQCAQCHNHPFDRWTQNDYYGWAAFFSQVGRKRGADPRETIIFDRRRGETKHPVTGEDVAPRLLGGATPDVQGKDRRRVVAEWIVSKDNPWFAENLVNMTWAHLFGRGLVHEPDDARVSNPPSNPALLAALARQLAGSNHDLRGLVRTICTSRAYQRSTLPHAGNEAFARDMARQSVRRLRAEVLLDAIAQATEVPTKFRGSPLGARAIEVADGAVADHFLNIFGRSQRTSVCSCEVKTEPNLAQALHLINGETTNLKIKRGKVVPRLLEAGRPPIEVARELTVRCLGRAPTETEQAAVAARLQAGEAARPVLEDLFWALLNSREFMFNH